MRQCTNCEAHKEPSEFFKCSVGRDGLQAYCKKCLSSTSSKARAARAAADPVYAERRKRKNSLSKALGAYAKTRKPLDGRRICKDMGATGAEIIAVIESRWEPGMSWDNYGTGPGDRWEIDHILPWAYATDWEKLERVSSCDNIQPMWANLNKKKAAVGYTVPRKPQTIK